MGVGHRPRIGALPHRNVLPPRQVRSNINQFVNGRRTSISPGAMQRNLTSARRSSPSTTAASPTAILQNVANMSRANRRLRGPGVLPQLPIDPSQAAQVPELETKEVIPLKSATRSGRAPMTAERREAIQRRINGK